MNKNVKIIFVILIIVLISIISFFGIYVKENFKYKSKLPEYKFTKSLGKTVISNLKIDETTNEVNYDENGNKVEVVEDAEENSNYITKQEPVNAEEVKTKENYYLCKEIIEKRLKDIGLPEYYVRVDEETGNIQIEFEQDYNVEAGTAYASYIGKAEFLDENEQVKLDNTDIKKAEVGYTQDNTGAYQVYLNIALNKQGQDKIKNIKNEHSNESEATNNTVEDTNETVDNTIMETTENVEKTLSFKFEDEEIGTVVIGNITDGKNIKVNIESSVNDTTTINNYLNQGAVMSILINSGKMPIKYEIENSQEFVSEVNKEEQSIIIYVLIGIIALVSICEIVKYRKNGILVVISNVAAIAIFLLILRYANVAIGYEAFFVCFMLGIILIYLSNKILAKLKNKNTQEEIKEALNAVYKEIMDVILVAVLVAIVFTFINFATISSMGMVTFWGIISIVISHFIFTRTLLLNNRKK